MPVLEGVWRHIGADARHAQIAALAGLLAINFVAIDFGATPSTSVLALASCLLTQGLASRCLGMPFDWRSPTITGLSLSLLLRAQAPWLFAMAGVVAISSKFLLRVDGKHLFNPAGFAIVILLLANAGVWISPGQWGAELWFAALAVLLALVVLQAARRADIAIFFLASHAALLGARALWLGDPVAIPLHQMQSGSLLIFAFFMISDPRTSPNSRLGRFAFAFTVAALGHYLAFYMQMRPASYFALIALSPLTLVIDRVLPASRFAWRNAPPEGASA
jgi:Na+-transporting NADH:ubiquinone oxidoreductase subunit NqrB